MNTSTEIARSHDGRPLLKGAIRSRSVSRLVPLFPHVLPPPHAADRPGTHPRSASRTRDAMVHRPRLDTIMYHRCQLHRCGEEWQPGAQLPLDSYPANLQHLVERIHAAGAIPALMT